MRLSLRHLFNIGVVIVMALIVITALGYDRQTRLLPLIVSVPVLILAVIHTVLEFRESRERAAPGKEKAGGGHAAAGDAVFAKEINVSLWVLGMFVSLYLFGFITTTICYTFLWLKVRCRFTWGASLGVSAGCFVFLYGVLITAMNVELYNGMIPMALRKIILGY